MSIQRRNFINKLVIAGLATSLLPLGSRMATADICRVCELSKLSPQRFVAGLVFDTVKSIVVDYVARETVEYLVDGQRGSYSQDYFTSGIIGLLPLNEYYKGSLIVGGITDYELHRDTRIKSILKNGSIAEIQRLERMKDYLRERNIYVKSAYTSISYPIDINTTLDDILSIEYFTSPSGGLSEDSDLRMTLEKELNVGAFREWMGA